MKIASILLATLGALTACSTPDPQGGETYDEVVNGTIAYPFVDETESLGHEPPDDRFVIKSAVGDKEYSIEIPGAARDYDVQVPLGQLGDGDPSATPGVPGTGRNAKTGSPVTTDKEMVGSFPRLDRDRATDTAMMDSAFGVGNAEGPPQAPSYTLGLAKVNDFFKKHQYEYALVEINNLLAFYPNSPKLHKMKGTVLLKMRNFPLAELAWIKALELDPRDKAVRAALERLQKRMTATGAAPGAQAAPATQAPVLDIPKPVGTQAPVAEPALTH